MVYPEQYRVLWYTSWLILLCSFYSFYRHYYDITWITFIVFLTSINHWRYPVIDSWRRYADLTAVNSALVYMLFRAWNAEYRYIYYMSNGIGVLLYVQSWKYEQQHQLWNATYAHACMHIVATTGNMILYSGYIKE
jgi:hypothetical protein